jgi:flagellar biosynthesis protein FliR
MINIEVVDYKLLLAFFFGFSRVLAISIQLPIFDNIAIPASVKMLTSLVLTYAFFPSISPSILADLAIVGENSFWILTAFNVCAGLVIGMIVKLIMDLFTGAGSIITQQIGFGMIRYFDPTSAQSVGPFEQLISWGILIVILSSGALLPMFKGLIGSFTHISFLNVGNLFHTPEFFSEFFKSIFMSSLLLASPFIFVNLLITMILGIISRMIPQMNVLTVSFVVNIWLGLFVFWACSDEFFQVAFKIYTEKLGEWFRFVS